MSTFEQAMQASGLIPGVIAPDGKWRRCYERLIAKRLADPVPPDLYSERHHILPKALGGSDKSANLVRLTAREHFVAHLLLARIFGGTMWLAVVRMKGRRNGKGYVNSRLYGQAKAEWAAWSSANQRGEAHWAFGKPSPLRGIKRPDQSGEKHPSFGKKKTREQMAAAIAANTGVKRSPETKKKIGDAQRGSKNHSFGKPLSDEHRAKVASALRQRVLSDEHKRRIGEAHRGRPKSEATKLKLSEAAKRRYMKSTMEPQS